MFYEPSYTLMHVSVHNLHYTLAYIDVKKNTLTRKMHFTTRSDVICYTSFCLIFFVDYSTKVTCDKETILRYDKPEVVGRCLRRNARLSWDGRHLASDSLFQRGCRVAERNGRARGGCGKRDCGVGTGMPELDCRKLFGVAPRDWTAASRRFDDR